MMRDFWTGFLREEAGATAAEYALLIAIVGSAIALAGGQLNAAISAAMNGIAGML